MSQVIPDVKINLDKERNLRFDLNAMVEFEGVSGRNIFDGTFTGAKMSAREIRAMLWACLIHEDKKLTLDQVGGLITVGNMAEVATKLGEAFSVATKGTEDKDASADGEPSPLEPKP
jgi:hypothetical protein